MPPGSARERDAVAVKISDLHAKNHLSQRRLVRRAKHESLVEPRAEDHQHQHDTTAEQMQAQSTVRKTTHHSRRPTQTENHADRPRHRSHDNPINDDGNDSNPEPSIPNSCGPDGRVGTSCARCRRRSNCCRRALGGGNGIQGAATAATESCLGRIWSATLIAIESCVHGGHYKEGYERCKPELAFEWTIRELSRRSSGLSWRLPQLSFQTMRQ